MSLTAGAGIAVGLYLAVLIGVGWMTRRHGRQTGLGDFYLAGRNLGGFVLLLTLYATQYSGNTLLGYPGEAVRTGYAWVMSVGFMMAIIVAYLLFAPRLQVIARRHHFVTPGDWIAYRFHSPPLTLIANVLLILAISNYLLAQLIAMGHVTEGLSGRRNSLLGRRRASDPRRDHLRDGGRDARRRLDRLRAGNHAAGRPGRPPPRGRTDAGASRRTDGGSRRGGAGEDGGSRMGAISLLVLDDPADRILGRGLSARDSADLRGARRRHTEARVQHHGLPASRDDRRHVHGRDPGDRGTRERRRRGSGDTGVADHLGRTIAAALHPLGRGHHRGGGGRHVDRRLGAAEPLVHPGQGHRRRDAPAGGA